jgi:hypothetical protein
MIRESIVTTISPAGGIHIAPIGVIIEGELLVVAPFRPSSTLDNLLGSRHAVINYVEDVRIFAGCVTGARPDWPTRKAEHVAGAIIEGSLAHDEVELVGVEDDETRPRLSCRSLHRETTRPFLGFNRAQASVIEASILASRLTMLPREKIEREMAYLAIAIEKTAGPREREAWSWLAHRIESYFAATQPQS